MHYHSRGINIYAVLSRYVVLTEHLCKNRKIAHLVGDLTQQRAKCRNPQYFLGHGAIEKIKNPRDQEKKDWPMLSQFDRS